MPTKRRLVRGIALLIGALALLPATAGAVIYSYPATYSGTAASGGKVEFDISSGGNTVTRFATSEVPTTCGTLTGVTTGVFPISNDSFYSGSATSPGIRFNGTFNAPQEARGVLSLRLAFPSCTSEEVSWTARTSVPPRDETPPQTKIKSGPKGATHSTKATFKFSSSEAGSKFQCKLDGKAWSSCKSPKTYKNLKPGKHTFKVRARDAAGNADQSPAKRSWHVEGHG
jgi:hypothetical protein